MIWWWSLIFLFLLLLLLLPPHIFLLFLHFLLLFLSLFLSSLSLSILHRLIWVYRLRLLTGSIDHIKGNRDNVGNLLAVLFAFILILKQRFLWRRQRNISWNFLVRRWAQKPIFFWHIVRNKDKVLSSGENLLASFVFLYVIRLNHKYYHKSSHPSACKLSWQVWHRLNLKNTGASSFFENYTLHLFYNNLCEPWLDKGHSKSC